jgi:hypothetical protein
MGRTRRGTPGKLVRVEGWRAYLREFGGLDAQAIMPYAIRGYFENGGEVAHVVRLCGPDVTTASALWQVAELDLSDVLTPESPTAFFRTAYRIEASSPGKWARNTEVHIRYRREGPLGKAEVDFVVHVPDEPVEYLVGLSPDNTDEPLHQQVERLSQFIRLVPVGQEITLPAPTPGPRQILWPPITLTFSSILDQFEPPGRLEYINAIEVNKPDSWAMSEEPEIAIVSTPDLHTDLPDLHDRWEIINSLVTRAEASHDRLILVDIPEESSGIPIKTAEQIANWANVLRGVLGDDRLSRAAAIYHPRLTVSDPLGGVLNPLRAIPSSGHVAGVISRMDRERGAHHTPANAQLFEALDVATRFSEPAQTILHTNGVNLLRCAPGRGIQVWGGRTLSNDFSGRFVAHRRLIHRLVRAIRRVAEPLVFYTNGPELWLTFVRSITTVLLETYRAGGLKGARPDEAFRVRCDEKTTTQDDIDNGRLFCEIDVAPAIPMEFITLRIAVSADATLEVFES